MTYTAHRDYRFEYATDVIHFIERNQCGDCAYRKMDEPDEPMCDSIAIDLILEEPIEALDDKGDDGVVCTAYRNQTLVEQEHPSQGRLFDA